MALQFSHTDNRGITIATAYARIENVELLNHVSGNAQEDVRICIFASQSAHQSDKVPMDIWTFKRVFDPATTTSFADIYTYLKTLPEFSGATDV